jgi:hypothetical protein
MKKLLVASILLASSSAFAGGPENSVGVGVEAQINGTGGLSVNYAMDKFHFGGFLGIQDPSGADNTSYEIGGRFYYHVHSTAQADFGIGGSIGLDAVPFVDAMGNHKHHDNVYLEPGFQIRVFLSANVALSFSGGIVIGVADTDGVSLAGQTTGGAAGQFDAVAGSLAVNGGAGVHYYFN